MNKEYRKLTGHAESAVELVDEVVIGHKVIRVDLLKSLLYLASSEH